MSKRHQNNRRKTYGRRQHELHERRQRDHVPAEAEAGLDDLGPPASPTASRSSTRARRACTTPWATDDGRLPGCAPAHHRPAAPPPRRARRRRPCRAAASRAAVRARRGPSRISILLAAIVVAFAGAFFSLSQDIRVSATGYELDRLATEQQRLEAQAEDLRNELNRLGKAPAIRKQAIDAGLGPAPRARDHPGPLGGAASMLGRTDSRTRALLAPPRLRGGGGEPRRAPRVLAGRPARRAGGDGRQAVVDALRDPVERGSIYDRTGTVVLATSVSRDRLAANPKLLTPERRAEVAAQAGRRSSASRATPPTS